MFLEVLNTILMDISNNLCHLEPRNELCHYIKCQCKEGWKDPCLCWSHKIQYNNNNNNKDNKNQLYLQKGETLSMWLSFFLGRRNQYKAMWIKCLAQGHNTWCLRGLNPLPLYLESDALPLQQAFGCGSLSPSPLTSADSIFFIDAKQQNAILTTREMGTFPWKIIQSLMYLLPSHTDKEGIISSSWSHSQRNTPPPYCSRGSKFFPFREDSLTLVLLNQDRHCL